VTPETTGELLTQHVQLLQKLDTLWTAFTVLIFVLVSMIGFIFALAAWSVYTVNKRQLEAINALAERQNSIETSWKEVIELLMHTLRGQRHVDH
jgi:uncharacterized membrane protein